MRLQTTKELSCWWASSSATRHARRHHRNERGVGGTATGNSQSTAPTIGRVSSIGSAPSSRRTAMTIEHATKYYKTQTGSVHALEDLTLEIAEGEFVCILGPSWLWQEHAAVGAFGSARIDQRPDHAERHAGHRAEAGNRDDLPGCVAALAEPLPEHPLSVRDQENQPE